MSESGSPASTRLSPHADARDARAAGSRFSCYLAAGILGIILLLVATALYFLGQLAKSEEQGFRAQAANIVHLLIRDIEGEYQQVASGLRFLGEEYADQRAHGEDSFAAWMERAQQRLPALNLLRITNAHGDNFFAHSAAERAQVSIADRDYFIRLRDDPHAGLQVTAPLVGRTSGKRVIVLARRLADVGDRFAGVVLASIPVDHFNHMLARFEFGAGTELGLYVPRYGWVARNPSLNQLVQREHAEHSGRSAQALPSALLEPLQKAIAAMPEEGFFATRIAGVERSVAYRHSQVFDFYVVLDRPRADYMSGWTWSVRAGSAALAALSLLAAALGLVLYRNWQQQAAATARLVERDEWIRQAQQIAGLGTFSIDVAGDCWTATEAFDHIAGIDAAYARTRESWLALVHPTERAAVGEALGQAAAGEAVAELEYRIERPADGRLRWVSSIARLVTLASGKQEISGVVYDVTERKRGEDVLRRSEQLFRGFFENSLVGMATISLEKGWITINQTLCDILGYSRAQLERMTWVELTHPEDVAADLANFERVLAGEIDGYEMDKRFIRGDGEIIHAYIAVRAIRRADRSIEHFVALLQNITRRKVAEAMLRRSEADLRAAFQQANVGIAFVAPDGALLSVNDRLCEIVGYAQSELALLHFQDITHSDDLSRDLVQLERLVAHEIERYSREKRYLRKDGRAIWANVSVSLISNDDGTPNHFVSIIEDIDARKGAERELRRSRELLQRFLDHLPGLAYIKDAELRLVHANRRFVDLLNLDPERLIGRSNADIFPGEFGEKMSADDRRVLASGRTEVIQEAFRESICESTKFAIPLDDGPPMLGGITVDVTRRLLLEQRVKALLEINEIGGTLPEKEFLTRGLELAQALTGSKIGFLHFVNDDQQTIELVTWTAGALSGCSAAFDNHYPIAQAGIWADCFRERRAVIFNDYPAHPAKHGLPAGHTALQRLISVPVVEEGAIRMMIGVGNKAVDYEEFDVTTVNLLGNDLWRIVRRLRVEAALSRRLDEVTQLKDKLEVAHLQLLQSEKMSAIGQLAAGIAHELNNPIGFVYSNLGTLSRYCDDLLAIDAAHARLEALLLPASSAAFEEVRRLKDERDHAYLIDDLPKLIRESREGLERVRKIVLDLKDFARVGETDWQWADLEHGLDTTINIVANELKYKAEVERQYGALPPVRCLASQLNQVFMNVLINAAQAIETQGRITIRTATATATAGVGVVDSVWIEIEDNGRGMSAEVQKRLFEPFFTTKPVGKGTGLGLSISFGIIEKHHGRIDVRSVPGCGTTFRITLPIDGSLCAAGV